jgi:hypothetical protein
MKFKLNLPTGLNRPFTSAAALLLGTSVWGLNNAVFAQTTTTLQGLIPPKPVPATPEVNMGLVMAPIAIAILLFATRKMWRKRAPQKS